MISRYTRPEMAQIWSEQNKCAIMLEVELQACEAMEAMGDVPVGTTRACRDGSASMLPDRFPINRIDELERKGECQDYWRQSSMEKSRRHI